MRKMKDSGIEWVGEIPSSWQKKKIKHVTSFVGSGTTPSSYAEVFYDKGDVPWIQSGDLYGKSELIDTSVRVTQTAIRSISPLKVYEHDFIVMAMYCGGSIGNMCISKINACVNQACCVIKPDANNDIRFMYYWLLICRDDFISKSAGGVQNNISQVKIKNQYYCQPSLSEQQKIADFLDARCAEIDALTSDIKSQIETLEQYKKSVISEVVTKGLDPNVEMKNSGIEWVGEIPSPWQKKKIKQAISFIGSGTTPPSQAGVYYDKGDVPWIQSGDLYGKSELIDTSVKVTQAAIRSIPALKVYAHDYIVMAMYCGGSIGNMCISKIDACVNQACCVIKPDANNDMRFMYYWLLTCRDDFISRSAGGVQNNISQIKIKNQCYCQPSLSEQQKIADYLDDKCEKIDAIIAIKKEQLEVLAEYKKSLIYEYVTGKREVA